MANILKYIDYNDLDFYVYNKVEDPAYEGCSGGFSLVKEWLEKNDIPELFLDVANELQNLGIYCDCELARHGLDLTGIK